ncbi:MAG TPA: S49 family peptidase, partial [Planctomycetaceae bacterium]|nr:S49 family peptidase [Planctomycetaceae bacterium]
MKRVRQLLLCGAVLCGLSLVAQAATKKEKAESNKPTIPVFTLSGTVHELPPEDSFSFSLEPPTSFKDLTARMLKAGKDENVKAIVILWNNATIGGAQTEELRQVMAKVREDGKEIYAYTDQVATLKEYTFLSGASHISLPPTADLWITGLYTETPYLHGLLSLVGVKPDFLSCGEYKSAAEIFMREGPSPAAEKMQNWLLDSLFENYTKAIAEGRGVDVAKVKSWINGGPYTAEKAKAAGIIDEVEHRDAFSDRLREKFGKGVVFNHRYGKKKPPTIDLGNPFAAFQILNDVMMESQKKKKSKKDAIGIVYVAGAIELGGHEESPFGEQSAHSTAVRKALDK